MTSYGHIHIVDKNLTNGDQFISYFVIPQLIEKKELLLISPYGTEK
jgi:hypothetical protein